jgi:hypothetical protein
MSTSFDSMVTQSHRGKTASLLLEAPVDALSGVSAGDGDKLQAAFGIDSIGDLAENRYFRRAQAIWHAAVLEHDPGPSPEWQMFFGQAPMQHFVSHPSGRFRVEFGPVYYRGRLDGTARLLAVGQDPSTNEILAHRVFVGPSGQRVQRLIQKAGLTRSYIMLNTFLFSVFGTFDNELRGISLEPEIVGFRNAFLDRVVAHNPIQAVLTLGAAARHAVENWPGAGALPVFDAVHPAAPDAMVLTSWNALLPGLIAGLDPDDGAAPDATPYGATFTPADLAAIPPFDLPFGVPDFHREGGGHSGRDGDDKIVWQAP